MEPPIVTRVSSDISEPLVWTRCSPYLSLNPGETMRCSVTAPFPPSAVSEESLLTLNQGKKIKTRGILTFCNLSNSETQVLKVVELQAYFGIAKGEVLQTKAIQLKAKRGECINFITPIKNVSLCPLHLTLHAPSFLRFQKSTSTSTSFESIDWNHSLIPTAQTVDLSFTLDTTELTGGTHEWTILLKNAHNPFNDMSIPVSASITCLDLTIFGGDLDENNVLCLPSVWIPNLNPDITCDAWFNLTNMSVNEVRFTVSVELIQPVADLIQLLVLSRFSNSPLNWLTLPPNGSIEVKVKVLVLDNAKFTSLSPKWMLDERGVQLGKVFVENENGIVTIPVRGKLMEKICFDVDVSVLEVKIDVLSELHLTNLSQHHPLTLSTHLELLHELDSVHLHLPSLVHLNPSSVYTLPLKLEKSEFLESGDILWIHFTDLESVEGMKKSVKLRLREINDTLEPPSSNLLSVHPVFSPMLSQTGGSDLAPLEEEVLVVKGCTKKDKLYELDLGQQDLGTPSLTRKLSIELHQPLACRFVIKTVPSDTSDWLTLSKSEGQLDPVTQKSQILLLTFNLSVRNAYFSYIVIENLDYPSDIKWVKVSLEVVSKANPKKMRPFDLVCHGFNNNSIPVLRYEDVYYGTEYITRSFRIYNRESIPVEFSFNVQNLSPQDETQVLFSSSASSPVLVKEVIVMPESSYHVYLRFCPAPGSLDLNPELMETKIFEIQVHSRLIRDYLQTLQVIATCWFPRIKVSSSKLLFNIDPHFSHYTHLDAFISSSSTTTSPNSTFATSPVHSPKPFSSSINPYAVNLLQQKDFLQNFSKELIISNLHLSRYVPVIILNDAFFFEVNTTQEGLVDEVDSVHPYSIPTYTNSTHSLTSSSTVNQNSFPITPPSMTSLEQELQPGQHFSLRVRVKIDVVWSWLDRLKREKYIEESIMVYHHRYPTEHFVVSLKLSLGLLHDFAFSRWSTWPSTSSPSSSFLSLTKWLSLEYQIYQFLRQLPSSDPLLLAFPFHIIVDQLVYYATTMTGPTDSIFLLAFLLWSTVKNFSTDTALLDNQKYLGYFLSFFPPPSYIHPFPPLLENLQKLFLSSQPSSTVIPSTLS
ncbi:hypothetical protein HMI55_000905 [Coelomomyces lativittatus]|nr:hypothetical protein HMI55_000905 [Coelomomyces lativittatus]